MHSLVIDTPEKYEQLKQGLFDGEFAVIEVTSGAHPQVLLQPQYFENGPYYMMTFTSPSEEGPNQIIIFPQYKDARISFRDGINLFSGVPRNYRKYAVSYFYPATPNPENIDSILQWNQAIELDIFDLGHVVLILMDRIDELSKLYSLQKLTLSMYDENYEQINVATFIANLPSLREIVFQAYHMSQSQMEEFEAKNMVPSNWKCFRMELYIYYQKD